MKRIKIPLGDFIPPDSYFRDLNIPDKARRVLYNFPKNFIFVLDDNDPLYNTLFIGDSFGMTLISLHHYMTSSNIAAVDFNRAIYPHNSITDNHEMLVTYLAKNIDNHVGSVLTRTVVQNPNTGRWQIIQPLFNDHSDLYTEYKVTYLPRLRSMERITNITFTNKNSFDKEFRLKPKK